MMAEDGLRERKKRAAHEALGTAALRLIIEHGFENVTVEQIAAEAGMSERTFFNYFATKDEVLINLMTENADRVIAALRDRPLDEPVWVSIREAVLGEVARWGEPDKPIQAALRLMHTTPTLLESHLGGYMQMERRLAAEVAARIDAEPGSLLPSLVAATASTVIRVATEQWLDAGGESSWRDVLVAAFTHVSANLMDSATAEPQES